MIAGITMYTHDGNEDVVLPAKEGKVVEPGEPDVVVVEWEVVEWEAVECEVVDWHPLIPGGFELHNDTKESTKADTLDNVV